MSAPAPDASTRPLAMITRLSRGMRMLSLLALPALVLDGVASPRVVSDRSMQPTLNPDSNRMRRDWVLQNRWALHRGVNIGDVVSLWCAGTKRVGLA